MISVDEAVQIVLKKVRSLPPRKVKLESALGLCLAAVALGGIKDYRAVEPLIDALKDERLIVRVKSAYALYEVTGKDFGRSQEKWQEWWIRNKQNIPKGHGRK
ncbi:MAG: hypothetical protein ACUZ8N_17020 [Candidatus Scalindua sp.]